MTLLHLSLGADPDDRGYRVYRAGSHRIVVEPSDLTVTAGGVALVDRTLHTSAFSAGATLGTLAIEVRSAGGSAQGVLDEVVGAVADVEPRPPVPASPEVPPDRRLSVCSSPGRCVPEVGVVEQDVTPLGVEGDLAGHPLESERDALGPAEMASREQAEESVRRGGRIEVDGEGNPGPDVQMGSGLVVGVPADARVSRTRVRPGVLVHDAKLLVVEQPGVRTEEPLRHVDQRRVVDPPRSARAEATVAKQT